LSEGLNGDENITIFQEGPDKADLNLKGWDQSSKGDKKDQPYINILNGQL
jgi:hypothetical protein